MASWYNYDWFASESGSIRDFKAGVDGDVLSVPDGIASFSWGANVVKVHGSDGRTVTVETDTYDQIVFNYSEHGQSKTSVAFYGLFGTLKYDKNVDWFAGNGASELIVTDNWLTGDYNKKIYLSGERGSQDYFGVTKVDASRSSGTNEIWGNNSDNEIIDGSGGSALWGGWGGNDTLTGGSGADYFLFNRDGGHDVITDADSNDTVWLFDANPGDVSYYYDNDKSIMHLYSGSGEVEVHCSTGTEFGAAYPTYQFADGTRLNYINSNWRSAQ